MFAASAGRGAPQAHSANRPPSVQVKQQRELVRKVERGKRFRPRESTFGIPANVRGRDAGLSRRSCETAVCERDDVERGERSFEMRRRSVAVRPTAERDEAS